MASERRNEVRFLGPVASGGELLKELGVPGAAGLGVFGAGVEKLPGVPAVSVNNLEGRLCKRERPFCFGASVSSSRQPFLTLQSLLWLVSEMPRPVLTLEGWERGRKIGNAPHSLQKKKKKGKKIPAV